MNQKLLTLFLLVSCLGFSQAPINQFVNSAETVYAIVNPATPLDESTTGAGLTWNFTNLTQIGTNTDTNAAPTGTEVLDYPNTTEVLTITTAGTTPVLNKLFIRNNANEISLTGATQDGNLALEFVDNATLGTFPVSFSFSNSDATNGNFDGVVDGTAVSGTFTGTLDTDVDAHGTLNLNDFGLGAYSGNVTRLKTELDISLTVVIFNVGTVTQTNYYYYDDANGNLIFRTSINDIDINFNNPFGDDIVFQETIILHEAIDQTTLGTDDNSLDVTTISLYPNPATDQLHVKNLENMTIDAVRISDLNGRTVVNLSDFDNAPIDISNLQQGLYVVKIRSGTNYFTKKFIKK